MYLQPAVNQDGPRLRQEAGARAFRQNGFRLAALGAAAGGASARQMAAGGGGERRFVRAQKRVRVAGFAGRFAALGRGVLVFCQVGGRRHVDASQHLPEREQPGTGRKKACPTAVILDTQSVKNAATATGATVGFDAGKLVKGRKRLVLTDTLGHVLASRVVPADAADGPAAIASWDEVAAAHDLPGRVPVVFVDSSFNGVFRTHLAQRYTIRVEKPAHVLVEKTDFYIHAWRWIVERTFAWLSANRRLSRNTTEICAMPTPGLRSPTLDESSNSANANSF